MCGEQRDRVIAKLRLLSVDQLDLVESFLTHLECGDSSPLLGAGVCPNSDGPQQIAPVGSALESGNELPHSKFEKSYLARLNYVHQNPVKHGLAAVARQYRWCSAAWFERAATRAQVGTIYRFKIDKLNVHDDYEPL